MKESKTIELKESFIDSKTIQRDFDKLKYKIEFVESKKTRKWVLK